MACRPWLMCLDMAEMYGNELVKHTVPSVQGAPDFNHVRSGITQTMSISPDFTIWFDMVQEPRSGSVQGLPQGDYNRIISVVVAGGLV